MSSLPVIVWSALSEKASPELNRHSALPSLDACSSFKLGLSGARQGQRRCASSSNFLAAAGSFPSSELGMGGLAPERAGGHMADRDSGKPQLHSGTQIAATRVPQGNPRAVKPWEVWCQTRRV